MPKAFLLGDVHLGINQSNLDKWLSIHKTYFYDFLIPILEKDYTKGDMIFILGNLFDNKSFLDYNVMNFTLTLFNDLENYNIIILGGEIDNTHNSPLKILEKYKNIKIIKAPISFIKFEKNILLLPYDKLNNQLSELKKHSNVDYLFTHTSLKGSITKKSSFLDKGLMINDFINCKNIYSSGNHIKQKIDTLNFIGNSFHMDMGDKDNIKGLTIIDFETSSESFIENNLTPKFKTIEIITESDLDKISEENISDTEINFIDVIINNSVLNNSKEIKKKLEKISKKKSIKNIKYVNDTIEKEELEFLDDDFSFTTEDLLKEYIKKQISDEKLKAKILNIIDDTIKLSKK